MRERISTALIYLAVFVPLLFAGGFLFDLFAAILAVFIFSELIMMKKIPLKSFGAIWGYLAMVLYVLSPRLISYFAWLTQANILIFTLMALLIYMLFSKLDIKIDEITVLMFALFYIGNAFSSLIHVRDMGFIVTLYMMVIIWVTDSGAFLIGRQIGKKPLAPSISPNKTLEGAAGGIALSLLASLLFQSLFPQSSGSYPHFIIVIAMSIACQMGDLVESAIKRHYNIKDSGDILPGHGGLFDRFDSLIFLMNLIKILIDFGTFTY